MALEVLQEVIWFHKHTAQRALVALALHNLEEVVNEPTSFVL